MNPCPCGYRGDPRRQCHCNPLQIERYTSRAPGQAGSYFYGYSRLLQLRAETELALGAKFDQLAFNNFLLDQGLLPLDLLAKAVREEFVPAQKATAVSLPGGR